MYVNTWYFVKSFVESCSILMFNGGGGGGGDDDDATQYYIMSYNHHLNLVYNILRLYH